MEENWIKVYKAHDYVETNEPIWLEQVLIDNKIPYSNEIEEYWIGLKVSKYKKRLNIFVPQKYEKTVKKYIEEFQNPKSIKKDNIEELKDINDEQDYIEMKKFNKIRKIGFILWMGILLTVIIFGIIATIMTNI